MPEPDRIETKKCFSAELAYTQYFNLALQQNAVPVVSGLKLVNRTGADIEELRCRFSAVPDFICEKVLSVEKIKDGEGIVIDKPDIELNYTFLSTLSESVKGKLKLSVQAGDDVIFEHDFPCEAFAPDQWLGLNVLPELLAAFVTPNLDVVTMLQSSVAAELERATGSPAIQGYQADRKRVYEICAAIYRAIHSWGIRYSNPPSSFGTPGQRIRFADTVYQYKLGTCLDTTLLFASVMEACNLHPVLMLQTGHAYVGCHLTEQYFPDIPLDDLQAVRKLAAMDEFLVVETTMVTGDAAFSEAEAAARAKHLNIDGDFECAIDVVRARYSGIRPLPLKRSVNGVEFLPVERKVAKQKAENARELENEIDLSRLSGENSQPSRIAGWTKKLLDLSLRNRLLNVRDNRFVIPVACPDITVLEDKIAADESLSLNALNNLLGEKDLHDLSMLRNCDVRSEIKDLLEKELSQQRLWTLLPPGEMLRRLTALYRQGRTDFDEGGVNTIYLAIGFLEWRVSEREEHSHLAPILLLPVRLQRKSLSEGIRISRLDGDTVVNETLLELLRSQYRLSIPGLSPLPTDDSGVDVGLVMRIFRQAIKDMKGWEVREEACIGHFSFGKFVMWTDMTARLEILKKHPLIAHLISGGGLFDDGIETFPVEEIGAHLDLAKLFCPLSADSSQLAAVLYSELGKSFVLHGPPGTGKSQTITNIIAHNLALGKRVLFVSEKKAALDVVHKRLSQIGLKPFCLELHSNKAGKAEVLAQFAEALQVTDTAIPKDWENTVAELNSLRGELDGYVEELHRQYPNGCSAYDCFSHLLCRRDRNFPELRIGRDLLNMSRDEFAGCRQKLIDLAESWKRVAPEALAALRPLENMQWSPVAERELLDAVGALRTAAAALERDADRAGEHLGLHGLRETARLYRAAVFFETLKYSTDVPAAFFDDDFAEKADFISAFAGNAKQLKLLRERLRSFRLEVFGGFDFNGIAERLRQNETAPRPLKWLKNFFLLKELAVLKKSGGTKLTAAELKSVLPDAAKYVVVSEYCEKGRDRAASLLGKQWNDGDADWEALSGKFSDAAKVIAGARDLAGDDDGLRQRIFAELKKLMPDISHRCGKDSPLRQEINALLTSWNAFQDKLQTFAGYAPALAAPEDTVTLRNALDGIAANSGELRNTLRYLNCRNAVNAAGLPVLVSVLENGKLDPDSFIDGCDTAFFRTMLDQILEKSPRLCRFSGGSHNERIGKFVEFDAKYLELTRKVVFARLASRLPRRRSGPCPEGTELGILKRECEKRARQKPVRQLLEQIPTLAAVLKPCFLMSPLSVAQYLPADEAAFDLIVFDEASQIPVWDAIGVIARGRQLIVVGDPKQMPPTNFFQKGESDDEDSPLDDAQDLESILDECIVAGIHPTYLNWHYRSRHESLIAFSNHYYYEDRLCTFPAAGNDGRLGVRFEFVAGGVYDRTASRTNRKEAEALVKYVFDRLKSASGRYRSIGVVTFSQAQRDLIEDLMEKARRMHPELESFFSDSGEEPPFVKNLENVQGDERDVILFSIGYAPDADGKMSMNFGPLNRQGGERRLNVAITRAKEQVVVFSSIHAEHIELSRTNAVGAAHLKHFLDYAEKQLNIHTANGAANRIDGIAREIAGFLTDNGYKIEYNVGCSGFRIDLAVRDPEDLDRFLLGIECDNAAYAARNTARDRDDLGSQVLRGLGWRLYRAWCVDWAFDRKRAEGELLEYIERVRHSREEEAAAAPEPSGAEAVPELRPEPPPEAETPPPPGSPANRMEYRCWVNTDSVDQEDFYTPFGRRIIREQIAAVIAIEGPICEQLLRRRIARAWGFNRTGGNILKTIEECLPPDIETTVCGDTRVFWSAERPAAEYRIYRAGGGEEAKRTIDEIPPEELANAMYEVLMDFNSCEKDTLFRETVKLFGFSAVTAKARRFLELGFAALKASGRI